MIPLIGKAAILIFCLVAVSCSRPQATKNPTALALESLRRIRTATQVGVMFDQYSQLVIDAKTKTDEAVRGLPDDRLKGDLGSAAATYADGAIVWGVRLRGEPLTLGREPGQSLLPRYSIQVGEDGRANPETALKIIWESADHRLTQAEQALTP